MRTTIIIEDKAFEEASRLTGISEKGKLIREALNALIKRESGKRLIALGGCMPDAEEIPRRSSNK